MNNKKNLIILLLVFLLLIGGASILYTRLGESLAPDQLNVLEEQKKSDPVLTEEAAPAEDPVPTEEAAPAEDPVPTEEAAPAEETAEADTAAPEKILAPDFTVYDGDGNEAHLSDYIGKPIVLNFWASWCGPCQMEMPDFHEKYLELGEHVNFLMINMTTGRETLESAADFIAQNEYAFPVFYDTQTDAAMTYGAYSLPTTFFIDADGYVIAQATGAIDGETLQRGIDLILPQN